MTEEIHTTPQKEGESAATGKTPGVVIFVAVLHFLSAAFFAFSSLLCVLMMLFGSTWGMDHYVTEQVSRFSPANASFGLASFLAVALFFLLLFLAFFLTLAIGLLKGKKFAWYLQIAFSTLGLLSLSVAFLWAIPALPLGSILNIVILFFFFRPRIRQHFKV